MTHQSIWSNGTCIDELQTILIIGLQFCNMALRGGGGVTKYSHAFLIIGFHLLNILNIIIGFVPMTILIIVFQAILVELITHVCTVDATVK